MKIRRPSKARVSAKGHALSVRLSAADLALLRKHAAAAGVTVTDLVRGAVTGAVQPAPQRTVSLGTVVASAGSAQAIVTIAQDQPDQGQGVWNYSLSESSTEAR